MVRDARQGGEVPRRAVHEGAQGHRREGAGGGGLAIRPSPRGGEAVAARGGRGPGHAKRRQETPRDAERRRTMSDAGSRMTTPDKFDIRAPDFWSHPALD